MFNENIMNMYTCIIYIVQTDNEYIVYMPIF